ncbi:hypothetical protein GJ496_005365 [Pomphorhynchus laevis]|nr:hypothetical protein GJ496_005365 [Pomphorhynchus laevis]
MNIVGYEQKKANNIRKEGYLIRRSHRILRIWVKKWFLLDGNQIWYSSKRTSQRKNLTLLIDDLRFCNVRANDQTDKKFVFEITSLNGQYTFQTESSINRQSWIDSINSSIANSLKDSCCISYSSSTNCFNNDGSLSMLSSDSISLKSSMILERKDRILAMPGNDICADCSNLNPDWISINLGVLLCMQCSGIHRGLGVNISKIRSFHMDEWDLETLIMISELGNTVVNKILEAILPAMYSKPISINQRSDFIFAKYKNKEFIQRYDNSKSDEQQSKKANERLLHAASNKSCVSLALQAVIDGADVNCQNAKGETALILAVQQHSISMVEFLLLNNASTQIVDNKGLSPLHHAVLQSVSFRCQVMSLIKRNAACNLLDFTGSSPLDYALRRKDPDVVTWLRLVNLHRELEADDPNIEKSFLPFLEDPAYLLELASLFPI